VAISSDISFEGFGFLAYRLERASEPNGAHACSSKLLEKLKSETCETVMLLRNEAVYIVVPR
jgi:hypothetical protein